MSAAYSDQRQTGRCSDGAAHGIGGKNKEHPQITLIYHVNYEGEEFTVTIPGKNVIVEEDTDWYGPLGLRAQYGAGAATATTVKSPKTGEPLNGYTLWLLIMAAGITVCAGAFLNRKKNGMKNQK